ncbi:MAG TPA: type 1 glutamine amidotransferase domain-containing protein [Solirubrobacterales bacterium]|nr:type 1 glutamine amidotransferase domain-containing protein [Solirubrobacterales bacterium]
MTHHYLVPLEGKRAAVMIGPLFEDVEATYPYYRLQEAGAAVELIGSEGGKTLTGKKGQELTTENAAADLVAADLDLLVIAGGFGPDKLRADDGVKALVREMDERGKPIAFICHAGWVPASAGIVQGRRVTSYPAIADDMRNAGAHWEDAEVVVDRNFVSSRRPDDLPAFMRAVIEVAVGAEQPTAV